MEIKTVMKSKSSNSAIKTKSEFRNKKIRSNAEFQKIVVKKRGVYVEKKNYKSDLNEEQNTNQEKLVKAQPRQKPGKKRFVSSTFTISKTSTGTQYPDINGSEALKEERRELTRRREMSYEDDRIKKKKRYRSKVLNNYVGKEVTEKQVVVLQSQKDITQTPSMYSENDSLNVQLPFMRRKARNGTNPDVSDEKNYGEENNLLVKEILKTNQLKKDKRVRIDEPATLVNETSVNTNENNKGLYNFFVDYLETAVSVHNIKTEYDKQTEKSNTTSFIKVPLEINESVAEKLNIQCDECPYKQQDACCNGTKKFYCVNDDELVGQTQHSPASTIADTHNTANVKRLKAKSFSFIAKPKLKQNKITTEIVTLDKKKNSNRKQKKQKLLNLFKEQLRMEDEAFVEPQSLFDALKIISENKRRNEKSFRFEEIRRAKYDSGFPECMYRRRKVIPPGKKRNYIKKVNAIKVPNANEISTKLSNINKKTKCFECQHNKKKSESNYSLKVLGYDYQNITDKKQASDKEKEIIFTYQSTPSDSDLDVDYNNDLILNSASFFNSLKSPSLKSWI